MFPYLGMLAVPGLFALTGAQRARFMLFVVALLYFVMVGFRFQVGMDWNNYIFIYDVKHGLPLGRLLTQRDPGYGALMWFAGKVGGGIILINAVSGFVFTWGFITVAKRCREPLIAVCVATPLLVVAFSMSSVRQSISAGIIFYLMATWDQRTTLVRALLVLFAASFHFSAIFILSFVALATNAPTVIRIGGAAIVFLVVFAVIRLAPDSVEAYSRLYVGSEQKLSAPGAIVQTSAVAAAALIYFTNRPTWVAVNGDNPLYRNLAWASLLAIPAVLISSVGAYRFALYLWPMAMTVYSGVPAMIRSAVGRLWYRLMVVAASFAVLIGWLLLANNSLPWLPYKNWLLQPDGGSLISYRAFRR